MVNSALGESRNHEPNFKRAIHCMQMSREFKDYHKCVYEISRRHFDEKPELIRLRSVNNVVFRLKFKKSSRILKISINSDSSRLAKEFHIYHKLRNANIFPILR